MNVVADRYLVDRVTTASPAELTAMLFDAAVGGARTAQRLYAAGQGLDALRHVRKAQEVVLELRTTLDPSAGPLAHELDALYTWCLRRLVDVVARKDTAGLTDALQVLEPLQSAWRTSCLQRAA